MNCNALEEIKASIAGGVLGFKHDIVVVSRKSMLKPNFEWVQF